MSSSPVLELPQAVVRIVQGQSPGPATAASRRPWLQRFNQFRSSTPFIVFTVSMAVFTDMFVYGVIVPVVPFAFTDRMGVAEEGLQTWISVCLGLYSAGLIIGAPISGYFSDKLSGRRVALLAGLFVVIASTFMLCFAKNMATFAVGRFIQGASGAVVWTVGLALISDVAVTGNIAHLMGYPGVAMSLGIATGPLIGGVVYEKAGYYAVFGVCFGILVFDVALRLLMKDPPKKKKVPRYPSGTETTMMLRNVDSATINPDSIAQTTNDDRHDTASPSHDAQNSRLAPGDQDAQNATITLAILKLMSTHRVLAGLLVAVVLGWVMSAYEAILTIHLKNQFYFNSLQSGLVFLAMAVSELFAPLVGFLADKYGSRWIATAGFLFSGAMVILLRVPEDNSTREIVAFIAILALSGAGLTLVSTPLMGELTNAIIVEGAKHLGKYGRAGGFGQVYGLFNVAFALGSLVGPFQSGFVMQEHGWGLATVSLAVILFAASFCTVYYFDGSLTPILKRYLKGRRAD